MVLKAFHYFHALLYRDSHGYCISNACGLQAREERKNMPNLSKRCIVTTSISEITLHKYKSSYLVASEKPQPNASIENITAKPRSST